MSSNWKAMEYLDNWYVWLIVIFLILVFICVWIRWADGDSPTETCSRTNTDYSSRVEEVTTPINDSRVIFIQRPEYQAIVPVVQEVTITSKQSKGEKKCQEVLEELTGHKCRVQVRDLPELKNPKTKRNLELDLYIPELSLAVEYDGAQHRKVVKKFHRNGQADLDAQRERDVLKDALCKQAGIHLIRVPDTVKLADIRKYIADRLPSPYTRSNNLLSY